MIKKVNLTGNDLSGAFEENSLFPNLSSVRHLIIVLAPRLNLAAMGPRLVVRLTVLMAAFEVALGAKLGKNDTSDSEETYFPRLPDLPAADGSSDDQVPIQRTCFQVAQWWGKSF